MNIEEAKALIDNEAIKNLKRTISTEEKIDTTKLNGDAVMTALCEAINNGIIKPSSLSSTTIKMINSSTQTVSQSKLGEILDNARKMQPKLKCVISVHKADSTLPIETWEFTSSKDTKFNSIFEFVITEFNITPTFVREQLSKLLKPTIANNIGQFVAKYQQADEAHRSEMIVSITTISRLSNMVGYCIKCVFVDEI